jgi:pyruvate dehydrogenase E2 component (dihydrolipoamide acetyltransferase)
MMAYEVVMPQLGLSMDKGQIIEWLKKPGDLVRPGELLLVVESDKAALEVEAVESGRLQIVHMPDDGPAPVGQVIAYLLAEGEETLEANNAAFPSAPPSLIGTAEAVNDINSGGDGTAISRQVNQTNRIGNHHRRLPSTPAARQRAVELGLDWTQAVPTGSRGQVRKRDVETLAAKMQAVPQPAISMTPLARRLADALGLDPALLGRLYPGRRIDRAEVETAVRQLLQNATSTALQSPLPTANGPATPSAMDIASYRRPAGLLRMLIAERMLKSARETAAVTLTTMAEATELVKIRDGFKSYDRGRPAPGYNVLLAALVSRALVEHPQLNATLDGNEIVYWETVNIGIAVNTERGLVVPVIRSVQSKNLVTLVEEAADLLPRAAQGKALPDELSGGTFTITNLGVYEIDAFTPIINFPECAVLGVGRLVPQVIPVADQPVIRTMVALSLTFDHRLVDGAPAAAFLQRVKQFVEHPYLGLL